MNGWVAAAGALLGALLPCGLTAFRAGHMERLVGLEMTSVVATLLLLCLAVAEDRPAFVDVALTLSLLSFGGGLVFARFLERWL